jgi:hypothetical protein
MVGRDRPASRIPLPGGWLLDAAPAGSRRFRTAVVRPLTGYEEEWLAMNRGAASATCTSHLLDACIVGMDAGDALDDVAGRLLIGDRDYLMLELRRLTLGDRILAVVNCPSCGSKMDIDFDASAIPIERGAPDNVVHEVVLPATGTQPSRSVHFRLPCGADQEAVLDMDAATASEAVLQRCLATGQTTSSLTDDEKARVIAEMEARAPRIDLELDLSCPECGHGFLMPFDTTAFFLDELRTTAGQLLREVHCLALYYHWSEHEILALNRDRRRDYLALLSDLRREE